MTQCCGNFCSACLTT
ncbi:hypothetical protein CJ419_22480 [Vibrio navarrensis]|nr:hypothetical protein [Vibrio navarrensis]